MLLIFIGIIIFERFIYLNEFAVSKQTIKTNSNELETQHILNDYKRQFYSGYNYGLLIKLILHCTLLFIVMYMIFWYFPNSGNMKILGSVICINQSNCNDVIYNPWTTTFYFICCLYFFFSAIQIRDGWPEMRNLKMWRNKISRFNYLVAFIYLLIPYIFELRLLMDWSFTKTSLTIWQWFKLDELYIKLYMSKCLYWTYGPLGRRIMRLFKFFCSSCGLMAMLWLVIWPMILFSSLNPMADYNNITGAQITFGICLNNEVNTYKLLSGSQVLALTQMNSSKFNELNLSRVNEVKPDNIKSMQIVEMQSYSDTEWLPTLQAKESLIHYLNNTSTLMATFYLTYSFKRNYQPKYASSKDSFTQLINTTVKEDLYNAISNCSNYSVRLHNFYYKIIKLPAEKQAYELTGGADNLVMEGATVLLNCSRITLNKTMIISSYSWQLKTDNRGIYFITLSEQVVSFMSGYSALTLYISVVIVVGNYIKRVTRNNTKAIILSDMPETDDLLELCEGIVIHRLDNNLKMEGELYYTLIDIFRSPEVLKIITGSSLKSIKKKYGITIINSNN